MAAVSGDVDSAPSEGVSTRDKKHFVVVVLLLGAAVSGAVVSGAAVSGAAVSGAAVSGAAIALISGGEQ